MSKPNGNGKAAPEPAAPPIRAEVMSLDSFVSDPANVRRRDDRAKDTLRASLTRFGPARSIVVDGKGVIRAGNGTAEAAHAAGITKALVVDAEADQLVVVRRKDWSPSEATAYSLADNRTTDLSIDDPTDLASTLRALQSEDFDLSAVGFTAGEIDALCEGLGDAILPPEADGKEYDESVADEVEYCECPSCGHKWPK